MLLPICRCYAGQFDSTKCLSDKMHAYGVDIHGSTFRDVCQDLGQLLVRTMVVTFYQHSREDLALALETAASMLAHSRNQAKLKQYPRAYALLVLGAKVVRSTSDDDILASDRKRPDFTQLANALDPEPAEWASDIVLHAYVSLHAEELL